MEEVKKEEVKSDIQVELDKTKVELSQFQFFSDQVRVNATLYRGISLILEKLEEKNGK